MSTVVFLSAFILGLGGSFHCMGMCGPLALSITLPSAGQKAGFFSYSQYFLGKTLTYTLLGLIFGFFGKQIALAGWQQGLSVFGGVFMILLALFSVAKPAAFHQNALTEKLNQFILPFFGKVLQQKSSLFAPFWMGLLNGLLPCGLVYIGLAGAVATAEPLSAALFMLVFGVGTMPVLLMFLVVSGNLGYAFRINLKKATPVIMSVMGVLLILRGLDLGIPFISPLSDALALPVSRSGEAVGCH
jgi:sulfite exporter TauE/SafE